MALTAGTRVGPYAIVGRLGAGGPASARPVGASGELRRGFAEAERRPRC